MKSDDLFSLSTYQNIWLREHKRSGLMHSYFTTRTFCSNLSKFTNEVSLMGMYKSLVNVLLFISNYPPICFHGSYLVLLARNFSSTQHFKQLRPWLYEFFKSKLVEGIKTQQTWSLNFYFQWKKCWQKRYFTTCQIPSQGSSHSQRNTATWTYECLTKVNWWGHWWLYSRVKIMFWVEKKKKKTKLNLKVLGIIFHQVTSIMHY